MTATAERTITGEIDVRGFIQANYTPYDGDATFLSGPTPRTTALWHRLTEMFADRVPGLGPKAARLRQYMQDQRTRHHNWIREHGEDMPEIRDWTWQ